MEKIIKKLLLLIVLLLSFPLFAQAQKINGHYFSEVIDLENGLQDFKFYLKTADQSRLELKFKYRNAPRKPNGRIAVSGKYISEDIFEVENYSLIQTKTSFLSSPKTVGALKVGVALINVKDRHNKIFNSIYTREAASRDLGTASKHLFDSSFGQAFYQTANGDYGNGLGQYDILGPYNIDMSDINQLTCDSYNDLEDRVVEMLENDLSDFKTYDTLVLVFPRFTDCAWAGRANFACMGRVEGHNCLLKIRHINDQSTLAHELGHNLGFNHVANDLNNDLYADNNTFYGDVYTIMGSYFPEDRNILEDYFIASSQEQAKWITQGNGLLKEIGKYDYGEYRLKARNLGSKAINKSDKIPAVLKLKAKDGNPIYVSYNVKSGDYGEGSSNLGEREVLVHSVRPFEYSTQGGEMVTLQISYNAKVFSLLDTSEISFWPEYLYAHDSYNINGYLRLVYVDDNYATVEFSREKPSSDQNFCESIEIENEIPFSTWRPSWKSCDEESETVSVSNETLVNKCVDEDGDGWGWNGNSSCSVGDAAAQDNEVNTSKEEPLDLLDSSNGEAPCVDEDGDGWGWNGAYSCLVETDEESQLSGNDDSSEVKEIDKSEPSDCIDEDGDGWGWNGSSSCRVETVEATEQSGDDDSSFILEVNEDQPVCIDEDGDGWGWDGAASCRIN